MKGKRRVEERVVFMEFRKDRKRTEKRCNRKEPGLNHPTVQNSILDNPIPMARTITEIYVNSIQAIASQLETKSYLMTHCRETNRTYTIAKPDPEGFINTDRGDQSTVPNVAIQPTVGTAQLRIDILALSSAGNSTGLATTPFFDRFESVESVGTLPGYPVPYAPNENRAALFKGRTADGKVLPEGAYQLAVSGLRVFGNASSAEDWDTVKRVPFNVRYNAE
ncbi:hypothetical protein LA080_012989 [Diaporthe eres]|nr:hypothetical protein LA080_012989 [Diaporthe eres]